MKQHVYLYVGPELRLYRTFTSFWKYYEFYVNELKPAGRGTRYLFSRLNTSGSVDCHMRIVENA